MNQVTVSVSSAISLILKVLRWLKSLGADVEESYGIIKMFVTIQEPRCFLWWSWTWERRLLVAKIHIKNTDRYAEPSKNWVINAYGKDHLDDVTEWAKKLSDKFKVKVHVRLETEYALDLESEYM